MSPLLTFVIIIGIVAGLSILSYLILRKRQKASMDNALGMSLFLIRLPQTVQNEEEDHKEYIGFAEQLYTAFSGIRSGGWFHRFLYGEARIAFEIANVAGSEKIAFYIAVPKSLEQQALQAIHGVYADAEIEKVPNDYTIFHPNSSVAGSTLGLQKNKFLPVGTYATLQKDPLSQITGTIANVTQDQGASIQIIIRPAPKTWHKDAPDIIKNLREGKTLTEALSKGGAAGAAGKEIGKLMSAPKTEQQQIKEEQKVEKPLTVDDQTIQAISQKIQKPAFETVIRLVASGPTKEQAEITLAQMEGAFGQFTLPALNSYIAHRVSPRTMKKFIVGYSFRMFNPAVKVILNVEELASLYHLSTHKLSTPMIESLKTKVVAPPDILPQEGVLQLGICKYRGQEKPAYFASDKDRARHLYIIGQTGTGKSTFMQDLIRQDILAGRGVAVIDPHGDLVEKTLSHIPQERTEDVVLFEPFDQSRPMGLNMLEYDSPEQKDFAVQEMIAIFHKLFPPEIIGPMFEHYMRNAMLALMADHENPGTLVEIPRIFTDDTFMKTRLAKVKDPVVRQFWEKEWAQTTGQSKSDMLGYVVSKVGRFIENGMMRNIIGQQKSAFNLSQVMDEGKIFLANLSKGQTGEVNASLLGLILVTKIQMAAMKRANMPEEQRKNFYLYIDEFQNFTTDSIATILSEARKYRLNLTMAHQFIGQLDDAIRDSVFGNVGSSMYFRIGADDAEFVEKQVQPEFDAKDLIDMDNFKGILKLIINGQTSTPFIVNTLPPQEGNNDMIGPLKQMAKMKFGRNKEEVEQEIVTRANFQQAKQVEHQSKMGQSTPPGTPPTPPAGPQAPQSPSRLQRVPQQQAQQPPRPNPQQQAQQQQQVQPNARPDAKVQ